MLQEPTEAYPFGVEALTSILAAIAFPWGPGLCLSTWLPTRVQFKYNLMGTQRFTCLMTSIATAA